MTLIWMTLRLSFKNLWAHKMRALLTMLGIIIGVSSVILIMALGSGARGAALSEFRAIAGVDSLYLIARYNGASTNQKRISVEDCKAILREVPEVIGVSPIISDSRVMLRYGAKHVRTNVEGVAIPYFSIGKYELAAGRIFTPSEEERPRKLCVIGHKIVTDLFRGDSDWAVGKDIQVNAASYRIVGALKPKGGLGGSDNDDRIIVPYTTMMKRITGKPEFFTAGLQVKDEQSIGIALARTQQVMTRRHRVREGQEPDFNIVDPSRGLQAIDSMLNIFTIFIAAIAGVSLLVGGIGIMNIMLVTVTERTHEIGVRKALGAKRRDILRQFLLESLVVSLIGGLMGISLGGALATAFNFAVRRLPSAPENFVASVSLPSIALSFGFCFLIGIFFGLYPARKAALMNPIDALRFE